MRVLLSTCLLLSVTACTERGPAGPAGEPGPAGAPGAAGAQGPAGPPGEVIVPDGGTIVGPAGPPGDSVTVTALPAGALCPQGGVRLEREDGSGSAVVCHGAPGMQGLAGPQGAPGTPGSQGPAGPAGATGATGATGPQGTAGQSVTSTLLAAGDANCPYGGSRFVVGATTTYACNGAPGPVGPPGAPGSGSGGEPNPASPSAYSFAGFTQTTYTGNLGGIAGANAKCELEHAGSHLCTYREYQWAGAATGVPATGAFVDNYASSNGFNHLPRDRSNSETCSSWTSNTTYVNIIDPNGSYFYAGLGCGTPRPLACCRSNLTTFRGFTSTTHTGNMGGIAGANAICHGQFAGSHLCTYREYQWAGSPTGVPASGAFVDNYASSNGFNHFPRDRSNSETCSSWTSNTTYVNIIDPNGSYFYAGLGCGTPRPLACCGP